MTRENTVGDDEEVDDVRSREVGPSVGKEDKRENRVSVHTRLGIMHNRNWNVRNGGEEYITKIFNCRVHVRNITCP